MSRLEAEDEARSLRGHPALPPMLCRVFACLPVKSDDAGTLTPGTQQDGEQSLWKHTEHLAGTLRLPASVFPSLQCQGITSDDQLGSLCVEPSCWSCCRYFSCTIIFTVGDVTKPTDKNNEK